MKITLLAIGKTEDAWLKDGTVKYLKRISHYVKFALLELPELKNTKALSQAQQKAKEAEMLLKQIGSADHVILLDESGVQLSSMAFADMFQQKDDCIGTKPCICNWRAIWL